MKSLLAGLFFVGAVIAYKLCVIPPLAAPTPVQPVVYAPAPTPVPKPAPATPSRRLAPDGTFFVTQYVSVRTPNGVAGFEPGRQVKFVGLDEAKQLLIVTDGEYQAELGPMQLTNDLDLAVLAQRRDQASQQQLAALLEKDRQEDARLREQQGIEYSREMARIHTSASVGGQTALDQKPGPASAADRAALHRGSPYLYLRRRSYPVSVSPLTSGGGD